MISISKRNVGRVASCLSTMKLFGCMILTVFMLMISMEPNKVEAQEEPPYPPHNEVQVLREIDAELGLGKNVWNFSENPCNNKSSWFTPPPPPKVPQVINNRTVTCNCSFPTGECHIDGMYVLAPLSKMLILISLTIAIGPPILRLHGFGMH